MKVRELHGDVKCNVWCKLLTVENLDKFDELYKSLVEVVLLKFYKQVKSKKELVLCSYAAFSF